MNKEEMAIKLFKLYLKNYKCLLHPKDFTKIFIDILKTLKGEE